MLRTFATTLVLALTISAAQAGTSIVVRFSDLNVSNPGDAQILNSRIERAAGTFCASLRTSSSTLFYDEWYARCVRDASATTSARIASQSAGKYHAIASK